MKAKFGKLFNWCIALFGISLSSCDQIIEDVGGGMTCEYGCPNMTYVVSGRVTNESGEPIKGIWVSEDEYGPIPGDLSEEKYYAARYSNMLKCYPDGGLVYTDQDGNFNLSGSTFPSDTLHIVFVDVDGEENGSYIVTKQGAKLEDTHEQKKGSWYAGHFAAHNLSVTMKEKDAE